jgi:hypothetical protein
LSRDDPQRLQDILDAIAAIRSHVARGDLSGGLIFDAVRVRLIEIGEAIKALSPELLAPSRHTRGATSHACVIASHTTTSTPPTAKSPTPSSGI